MVAPPLVRPGDTVWITFESSEPLRAAPVVLLGGVEVSAAPGKDNAYTYLHAVTGDAPQGAAALEIQMTDLAGNSGTVTVPNAVQFAPGLPVAALPLLPALALCGMVLLRRKGRKTL